MQRRSRSVHKNAGFLEEDILFQKLHINKSSTRKRKANSTQHTGKRKSSRKNNDLASSSTSEEVGAGTSNKRSFPNEAVMSVDRDANEYNMQHQNRGHVVIFNHDQFDKRCKPRVGSKHDVESLQSTFSSLGFIVTVHNNRTLSQIKRIISTLADEDYSDDDCLVVIVLTHGNVDGDLVPREGNISYGVEVLWEPFTSDKCDTLAGKPKLFFIQACRGLKVDVGTKLKCKSPRSDETDSNTSSYSIPTHADFLIAHSTVEGFTSIRNTSKGTWFIQGLCEELNTTDSLQQILTKTTRRIALQKSSHQKKQKQVPSITTTLTRELYFHPKNF